MTRDEFHVTLSRAISGGQEALADIMEQYMPLINRCSYFNATTPAEEWENRPLRSPPATEAGEDNLYFPVAKTTYEPCSNAK